MIKQIVGIGIFLYIDTKRINIAMYKTKKTYRSLSVLDLELTGDLEALPVLGGLGDVVTDLLGRQTKGTDLDKNG